MEEAVGSTTAFDQASNITASLVNSPVFAASTAPIDYSSYTWSNGSTAKSIVVNAAGNYSVTGKQAMELYLQHQQQQQLQ